MDDELAHADDGIGGDTCDAVCAYDRNGPTLTPVVYLSIVNAPWVSEDSEAPENDCRD
jgi:hypothetical protein